MKNYDENNSLLSEIIAEAGQRSAESVKDVRDTDDLTRTQDNSAAGNMSGEDRNTDSAAKRNEHLSFSGLKGRIKNSDALKPEMIRDMFFGSKITDRQSVPEEDYDVDDPDEDPLLFSKGRKQRIAADPANDKIIFSIDYMLTPEQVTEGYMLFYNEFIRRSNIKVTVIFGIISFILLFSIIISPNGYLNYLLLLMVLAVIAMKWITSLSAKKDALMTADDVKNDNYKLVFYNSRILLQASGNEGGDPYNYTPVMIRFEDIDLKVLDYEDLYVLIFKKSYVYTIPKEAMDDEQNEVFKSRLKNILGDDYLQFYSREKAARERADRLKARFNNKFRSNKKA